MSKFNVYDAVWIIRDNKPKEMIVFAVIESMAFWKNGETEIKYRLVENQIGAGWGNNEGYLCAESMIYKNKDELINSLR